MEAYIDDRLCTQGFTVLLTNNGRRMCLSVKSTRLAADFYLTVKVALSQKRVNSAKIARASHLGRGLS